MSKAEDYLPLLVADGNPYTGGSNRGVQIGDAIITGEDVWCNTTNKAVFTLLDADGSAVDETKYPVLANMYQPVLEEVRTSITLVPAYSPWKLGSIPSLNQIISSQNRNVAVYSYAGEQLRTLTLGTTQSAKQVSLTLVAGATDTTLAKILLFNLDLTSAGELATDKPVTDVTYEHDSENLLYIDAKSVRRRTPEGAETVVYSGLEYWKQLFTTGDGYALTYGGQHYLLNKSFQLVGTRAGSDAATAYDYPATSAYLEGGVVKVSLEELRRKPDLPTETGSPFPYKIVADHDGTEYYPPGEGPVIPPEVPEPDREVVATRRTVIIDEGVPYTEVETSEWSDLSETFSSPVSGDYHTDRTTGRVKRKLGNYTYSYENMQDAPVKVIEEDDDDTTIDPVTGLPVSYFDSPMTWGEATLAFENTLMDLEHLGTQKEFLNGYVGLANMHFYADYIDRQINGGDSWIPNWQRYRDDSVAEVAKWRNQPSLIKMPKSNTLTTVAEQSGLQAIIDSLNNLSNEKVYYRQHGIYWNAANWTSGTSAVPYKHDGTSWTLLPTVLPCPGNSGPNAITNISPNIYANSATEIIIAVSEYHVYGSDQYGITFRRSTDGGQTFTILKEELRNSFYYYRNLDPKSVGAVILGRTSDGRYLVQMETSYTYGGGTKAAKRLRSYAADFSSFTEVNNEGLGGVGVRDAARCYVGIPYKGLIIGLGDGWADATYLTTPDTHMSWTVRPMEHPTNAAWYYGAYFRDYKIDSKGDLHVLMQFPSYGMWIQKTSDGINWETLAITGAILKREVDVAINADSLVRVTDDEWFAYQRLANGDANVIRTTDGWNTWTYNNIEAVSLGEQSGNVTLVDVLDQLEDTN